MSLQLVCSPTLPSSDTVGLSKVLSCAQPPTSGPRFSRQLATLVDCPYAAIRRLTCDGDDGVLTLSGYLPSYFLKQVAIATAKRISGITAVIDRTIVRSSPPETN